MRQIDRGEPWNFCQLEKRKKRRWPIRLKFGVTLRYQYHPFARVASQLNSLSATSGLAHRIATSQRPRQSHSPSPHDSRNFARALPACSTTFQTISQTTFLFKLRITAQSYCRINNARPTPTAQLHLELSLAIKMRPYQARSGPSRAAPSNVQCQKCLKRDKCFFFVPLNSSLITDSRRTPLLLRMQGCAPRTPIHRPAVAHPAIVQP